MQKNDIVTATVESVGAEGEGILRLDGTTVFVPFVICGEKIDCRILKVKGKIAFGKVEKILVRSDKRVEPRCSVFKKCGGCKLQHANYDYQLLVKRNTVKDAFSRIAYLDVLPDTTVPSQNEFRYRNKLQLPIRRKNGVNVIGFFRENSHDVVEIDDCPLQPLWVIALLKFVKEYLSLKGVFAYDEASGKGGIKHIVVRECNGSALITFVNTTEGLPFVNRLIEGLSGIFKDFSLFVNVNKRDDNVVMTERFIKLYGLGKIDVNEFGITYEIGAGSFYQVNDYIKSLIYKKVLSLAAPNEDAIVVDAYSGAGIMTAMLAKKAKIAYGIEIVEEAVKLADKLKSENGLDGKMVNICGDCGEELPKLISRLINENSDCGENITLVIDPPRKGIDKSIIEAVIACGINRIIYVSCSPQSLARDVGLLVGSIKYDENGVCRKETAEEIMPRYKIEYCTPYDMFPNTPHVETLISLCRK